ncbi:MAG: CRISPR-associated helicase Cas3', partial [Caldilineaceae bacterium]|nr:CRISPR-associated helicase Cas3' [Caldilineaceae bacterium]
MTPVAWPTWMNEIWAKSAEKGEGGEPETLAQHTWYVLQRLSEFIQLRPNLPQQLAAPRLWHILYWAAFLHDFGKAASGFQARLRGGERWPHRHEVFSLAFVDWIVEGLTPEEKVWVVAAIASHHRDASDIYRSYAEPEDPEDDPMVSRMNELDPATVVQLWRWLYECGNAWIDELGLRDCNVSEVSLLTQQAAASHVQQNGLQAIYRWLKQYRRFVQALNRNPRQQEIISALTLRGYIINADHSASAHADALPQISFEKEIILSSRDLTWENLFDHQRAAGETVGSTLLTAPTGSGKTEAALLWVAHQYAVNGRVPRLFYTLPYQASMNAMQLRLQESFGEDNVGLQHGRSLLVLYRFLLERDYDLRTAARQAKWSRNLVQLNYPPIRVFSPYQMLKGMYRLKGYEAILSDYHNAAFIFDEIHAYEVKRLALILKTIEYLKEHFNASFFIMSATFPTAIKRWLNETLSSPAEITAKKKLFEEFQRHRLHLLEGELTADNGLNSIITDAKNGKSVLVVCNVVSRAQEVYDELVDRLRDSGVHVELLHGRFNIRDRATKEALVRNATGSKSKNRKTIVLVATQVVEVSLDIDMDTIYTDPAPLEALVQRFGRINRRRKMRDLAPVHVFALPDDGQGIYDPELVQRTIQVLNRENSKAIDEGAIGDWLDEIYAGAIEERWQTEFMQAAEEFEANCLHTLRPFEADPNLEDLFYKAFDGLEILPAQFYEEYKEQREEEPIRAGELLVPISIGRYHALCNAGKVWPREKGEPYVIEAEYSPEKG